MKENDSLAATQKGLHSGETVTPSGGVAHNHPENGRSEPAEAKRVARGLDAASLFGLALGLGLALSQRLKQRLELQLLCREIGQLLERTSYVLLRCSSRCSSETHPC